MQCLVSPRVQERASSSGTIVLDQSNGATHTQTHATVLALAAGGGLSDEVFRS